MDISDVTIGLKHDIKNEKDANKKYYIYAYVGYQGKRKYINTGVKCRRKFFNGQYVVGMNAREDNEAISDTLTNLRYRVRKVIDYYRTFSIELFNETAEHVTEKKVKMSLNDNFIMYAKKVAYSYDNLGTQKSYFTTIRSIENFGKILRFKDLTIDNIKEYDIFLDSINISDATINKYHKRLSAIINKSKYDGYVYDSPYLIFRPRKFHHKTLKYLEEEDLQKIMNFSTPNKMLQRVRDLFVFQAMTGLSYSDAIKVSKDDIKVISGKRYIVDRRIKTGQEYAIRLYAESDLILLKYKYDMNFFTNQVYNRNLKSLALILGLREDLTSHMARHTFATIALNRGVSLEIVAKMLGHSTSKCTEIYAKYLQKTIEREGYDKLESFFVKDC